MAVIGLDLGGTKLASAIFSENGEILHRAVFPLDKRSGADVGALLSQSVTELLDVSRDHNWLVKSIGVSVPGIYYADSGKVWAPNIPGWEEYPLLAELRETIPETVKVRIDSDRACYILGETWQGSAQGCKNAVFIAFGTGIGAGILVDGNILRGAHDIAGATGWMALNRPFMPGYEAVGCFEYNASGDGIARVARDLLAEDKEYTGVLSDKEPADVTSKDVFAAYESEDLLAQRVLENAIQFWGMGVANFVSLFNPEMIILGGGVFGPADQFLDDIWAEAEKWAQPISMKKVKLAVTSLGSDAGLYGTGQLALNALKS